MSLPGRCGAMAPTSQRPGSPDPPAPKGGYQAPTPTNLPPTALPEGAPADEASLLRAYAGAVLTVGDDDRILFASPAALALLGWGPDLQGRTLTQIIPDRLQGRHLHGFERYVHTGESRLQGATVRVPARRRDGSEIELDLTIRVFRRPDGSKLVSAAMSQAVLGRAPDDLIELESALRKRLYELI